MTVELPRLGHPYRARCLHSTLPSWFSSYYCLISITCCHVFRAFSAVFPKRPTFTGSVGCNMIAPFHCVKPAVMPLSDARFLPSLHFCAALNRRTSNVLNANATLAGFLLARMLPHAFPHLRDAATATETSCSTSSIGRWAARNLCSL